MSGYRKYGNNVSVMYFNINSHYIYYLKIFFIIIFNILIKEFPILDICILLS